MHTACVLQPARVLACKGPCRTGTAWLLLNAQTLPCKMPPKFLSRKILIQRLCPSVDTSSLTSRMLRLEKTCCLSEGCKMHQRLALARGSALLSRQEMLRCHAAQEEFMESRLSRPCIDISHVYDSTAPSHICLHPGSRQACSKHNYVQQYGSSPSARQLCIATPR